MPMYTYECSCCGRDVELIVNYEERDVDRQCDMCGGYLERVGIEKINLGSESYQMKAVLGSGAHVSGHFGKQARGKRK